MNLKSRRESLGLTLEQAGRGIGGRQKVYRFESGERDPRRMRLDTAQRYADNLGVTLDALWELCQPDNAKSAPSGRRLTLFESPAMPGGAELCVMVMRRGRGAV